MDTNEIPAEDVNKPQAKKALTTHTILEAHPPLYAVKSITGGVYLVDMTNPAYPTCSCPENREWRKTCNHIRHVQDVVIEPSRAGCGADRTSPR